MRKDINAVMSGRVTVSADGRSFIREGRPFFYLGDTAWLLFSKLAQREAQTYLRNRAAKGFTVIQATLVHMPGMKNFAGAFALEQDSFGRPVRSLSSGSYWGQVRDTVAYAASLGLVMALLPAWGSFASGGSLNGENVCAYTDFLSDTLGGYDNVIWLVGGDVRGDAAPGVFELLGSRLREKCPGQLIGYHPFGRCSSSQWFHCSDWLDFNMFQSGHRDYDQKKLHDWDDASGGDFWYGEDNFRYVLRDRGLSPAKPTLDGEPSYELIPHGLHDSTQPYWQACDVRRYAYWSVLAGAAGHTYGDNAIMQFHRSGDKAAYGALQTWDEALHNPGSMQMGHLRRVMEATGWQDGTDCPGLLVDAAGERHEQARAMACPDAALVYTYSGKPFTADMRVLGFPRVDAWWFDPVAGGVSYIGSFRADSAHVFTPPDKRSGQNDWLLVLTEEGFTPWFLRRLRDA